MMNTPDASQRAHILIIEDSLGVARALNRTLSLPQGGGYWVETCESGEAALERLRRARFDLLITDLRLPGMNGLALLEHASHPRSKNERATWPTRISPSRFVCTISSRLSIVSSASPPPKNSYFLRATRSASARPAR
jgi:CheY-like chemotaxis protein